MTMPRVGYLVDLVSWESTFTFVDTFGAHQDEDPIVGGCRRCKNNPTKTLTSLVPPLQQNNPMCWVVVVWP
jgi:hypothetical protein